MLDTFEALAVAIVAVLPGATFTWAFEQRVDRVGANLSDRVWRFAGVSAVFVSLLLPLLYLGYRHLVVDDRLRDGGAVPWWLWLIPPVYVVTPWLIGVVLGRLARARSRWVSLLTGPAPSPRAWDHLFTTPELTGWLLLRLKSGEWIVGFWGRENTPGSVMLQSCASGYPDIQELYLADTGLVDERGAVQLDDDGRPVQTGLGLLIRWDEVAYVYYAEG